MSPPTSHLLLMLTLPYNPFPLFAPSISSLTMCLTTPPTKSTYCILHSHSPYYNIYSARYYRWSHGWGSVYVVVDVTVSMMVVVRS